MKPPCEMVVWYIIPGIRAELSKSLFKLGMNQKNISSLLEITQPAVSQYLTDKRGNEIEFNDEIKSMIEVLAIDLKEGKVGNMGIIPRICQICKKIKSEDILCFLHKEKGGLPEDCEVCMKAGNDYGCMND